MKRLRLGGLLALAWLAACEHETNSPGSYDQHPDYDPRAITRCEHGVADDQQAYTVQQWRACLWAARAFADNPPVQLRYARMSCDLGYDEGCLAYLDFVHAAATRNDDAAREHLEYAKARGKKFCEEGLKDFTWRDPHTGEACHKAGLLFQDVAPADPETARAMFSLGCKRSDEGSCTLMRTRYAGSASP